MSTPSQIAANRANSVHSTGPTSSAGKAASSQNNLRHGFTGRFCVFPWETQENYNTLLGDLTSEHQPTTPTESFLVEQMAQSYWLRQRALFLQDTCFKPDASPEEHAKQLALYIRYQVTHERAFHKALNDLLKLRAERRKAEIGFESQKHALAAEARREAKEKRTQEYHHLDLMLAQAKVEHQEMQTRVIHQSMAIASATETRRERAEKAA